MESWVWGGRNKTDQPLYLGSGHPITFYFCIISAAQSSKVEDKNKGRNLRNLKAEQREKCSIWNGNNMNEKKKPHIYIHTMHGQNKQGRVCAVVLHCACNAPAIHFSSHIIKRIIRASPCHISCTAPALCLIRLAQAAARE